MLIKSDVKLVRLFNLTIRLIDKKWKGENMS